MVPPSGGLALCVVVALSVLLLASCAGRPDSREGRLNKNVRAYNDAMRWQSFGSASNMVAPEYRPAFREQFGGRAAENLRITEYNIREVRFDRSKPTDDAMVVVEMHWHRLPDMTVRRTVEYQQWQYMDGVWLRGAVMLTDPLMAPAGPATPSGDQNGMGSSSNPSPGP
jgi:hypothetical protein